MTQPEIKKLPTTLSDAWYQVREAMGEVDRNYAGRPALPWRNLEQTLAPPLPRDFWIVGARTGNGKSSFCMNLFDNLVRQKVPTLYIGAGAEGPPKDLRRQWTALRLGYGFAATMENLWQELPHDAREQILLDLSRQATDHHQYAMFAEVGEQLDTKSLVEAMNVGSRAGMKYVILDHIHRLKHTATAERRDTLKRVIEWLRNMAAKYDLSVIVAAQLRRANETGPLRDLVPPTEADLAECGALEQEAVVILLLHRVRRPDVTVQQVTEVMRNQRPVSDVVWQNVMAVRVAKHRRRGWVKDQTAFLDVDKTGRLTEHAASLVKVREREPGEEPDDQNGLPF